jgi:RNA polymerase sigma factor (sigma-70 family)
MATEWVDDDARLAARVRNGDREAEAELAARFYGRVLAAASFHVRDRQAAFDITHEVLVGVLCGLREGRLRKADHLPQYIAGTVRNVVRRHRMRRCPLGCIDVDRVCDRAPPPDQIASYRQTLHVVRRAFNNLPPKDRGILGMMLIEGFTSPQVARRTGMTADQVRQRKARAIRRLRVESEALAR